MQVELKEYRMLFCFFKFRGPGFAAVGSYWPTKPLVLLFLVQTKLVYLEGPVWSKLLSLF